MKPKYHLKKYDLARIVMSGKDSAVVLYEGYDKGKSLCGESGGVLPVGEFVALKGDVNAVLLKHVCGKCSFKLEHLMEDAKPVRI